MSRIIQKKLISLFLFLLFFYPVLTFSQERAPIRIAVGEFKRIQNPYHQEIDLGNALSKYLGDVLFKLSKEGSQYVERGISLVEPIQEFDILVGGFYDVHQAGRYVISGQLSGRREVVHQITGETSFEAFASRVVSFILERHGKESLPQSEIDGLISSSITDGFSQSIDMRIGSYVALRRQVTEKSFDEPEVVSAQYKVFKTIPGGYISDEETNLIQVELANVISVEIIKGKVTDSNTGKAIKDVTIYTDPTTESIRTNVEGKYLIDNLSPGFYRVYAEANQYVSNSSSVKVPKGGEITADIKLTLIPLERNILWAVAQSLAIPGLGQFYNEDWGWGVGYLTLSSIPGTIMLVLLADQFFQLGDISKFLREVSTDDKQAWFIGSSISLITLNILSATQAGVSSYDHNLDREKLISHADHPSNSISEFVFLAVELKKDTIGLSLHHRF